MFRFSAKIFALLFLTGCGLARQQEAQDRLSQTAAEAVASSARCDESFPKRQQKTAVARSHCLAEATAPLRPLFPYPDIYDQEISGRNLLSERWQAGKITEAEYEAQFYQMHSQATAERERRKLATRSVNAQEMAATAAASPVICNKVGTTTICN